MQKVRTKELINRSDGQIFHIIEQFTTSCRKTKTQVNVITTTNQSIR